ncbi:hypothetical protein CVT25_006096 [Psilocybe cyanescens]|uniref:Uncharacterized protein n=1 Tax=Psilocybe cyanescens TaxID=93625 RepID=A0A409XQP7_PSICY|nr:hypothetical protein CVT25_006096 [Psilocybe cyanescens]
MKIRVDRGNPDTLSITTSPSKLVKVAHHFELKKNNAQAEAQELQQKLTDITNWDEDGSDTESPPLKQNITNQEEDGSDTESPPPKRSRTNNEESGNYKGETEKTQVINAGHQFVILYSLWLWLGAGTFKVEYDPNSNEAKHFENEDSRVQGQLQEIKQVLGPHLFSKISSEAWIAKAFTKSMKSQHSNTATQLQHHCATLFGVSDTDMLHANIQKEKFREHIGWVDDGHGSGLYSTFLNPILIWVFLAIIWGPTTAKEAMNGILSNPKTDTMAQKHSIQHTTPGAIAGSVVLSRWALSSDDFLQSVGTNTSINYEKDFAEYLEILVIGLQEKRKSVFNVFREWDQIVFPNSDSILIGCNQDTSRGLKTALEMLKADEIEEDAIEDEDY